MQEDPAPRRKPSFWPLNTTIVALVSGVSPPNRASPEPGNLRNSTSLLR
jgi:hypothetical protein